MDLPQAQIERVLKGHSLFLDMHAKFFNEYVTKLPSRHIHVIENDNLFLVNIKVPDVPLTKEVLCSAVKKIPAKWQDVKIRARVKTTLTKALGVYAAPNAVKDDIVRDYVYGTQKLTVHPCTTLDDVYEFFRPNIGCIAVGGTHTRYECGWELTRIFAAKKLFPQSWILGVEGLTPYYVTAGCLPVGRFFKTAEGNIRYFRASSGYTGKIQEQIFGNKRAECYEFHPDKPGVIIRPPRFMINDTIVLPSGPMDGAYYHNIYYNKEKDDMIFISYGGIYSYKDKFLKEFIDHNKLGDYRRIGTNDIYGYTIPAVSVDLEKLTWRPATTEFILGEENAEAA